MTGSPSAIISMGLGSWGNPSLVITLGYGQGAAAAQYAGRIEYTMPASVPDYTMPNSRPEFTVTR